jgi:acetyl-CoA carboxylase carboxyl transferase subunit beta
MSWVTRVRNAIPFIAKRETTETLWHKCKGVPVDDLPQGI